MVMGYSYLNGFKTIEVEDIIVYGKKQWNFKFLVNGRVFNERTTDDKARYIKALSTEYYFEEDSQMVEI